MKMHKTMKNMKLRQWKTENKNDETENEWKYVKLMKH